MDISKYWNNYAVNQLIEQTKQLTEQVKQLGDVVNKNFLQQQVYYLASAVSPTSASAAAGGVEAQIVQQMLDLADNINSVVNIKSNVIKIQERQERLRLIFQELENKAQENIKTLSNIKVQDLNKPEKKNI